VSAVQKESVTTFSPLTVILPSGPGLGVLCKPKCDGADALLARRPGPMKAGGRGGTTLLHMCTCMCVCESTACEWCQCGITVVLQWCKRARAHGSRGQGGHHTPAHERVGEQGNIC
jgi:hypothetical protein